MAILNKVIQKLGNLISQHIEKALQNQYVANRQKLDNLLILQGRALALKNADRAPLPRLQDSEFKVFSQFGEDGILQYLIREAGITSKESIFVEFGVQDYTESNTRFLLMNNNWRGLIIDGSQQNMDFVRSDDLYWKFDLTAVDAWVDRDNINHLIGDHGFSGDIGILSIDIDGNDYWVWECIEVVNPVIVVVEWNSVFGPNHSISVPYDHAFLREKAHYSNLFWGASLAAFNHLATSKRYKLLGSNTAGNNLFFVRKDRLGRLTSLSVKEAYVESKFRDSKGINGNMNFLAGEKRCLEIYNLPVVDVVSGKMTTMRALDESFHNSDLPSGD